MSLLRWLLALLWVIAFLSGRALLEISTAVSDGASIVAGQASRVSDNLGNGRPRPESSTRPRIDLYGNPIDEAVGDYRIDDSGDLYERHAPDTAVLNLPPASL